MDGFEVILVLGFIIYSIWSEVTKGQSGSSPDGADLPDLKSIGEFFKKKSVSPGQESNAISEPETASTDFQSSSPYSEPVENQSSFISDNTKQHAAKSRKSRKKTKVAQQRNQSELNGQEILTRAALPEKTNYDKLGALTGQYSHDLDRPEISSVGQFYNTGSSLPRHKFKLDRERLINGFIMTELLQRRDFTKIFERIPSVRKD